MSHYWDRVTRLNEGPGERYEGRVSKTPVTGMIHRSDCTSIRQGLPLYRDTSTMIAELHHQGVGHRGVMSCSDCDAYDTVNSVRAGLRYLSGTTDLRPYGLTI